MGVSFSAKIAGLTILTLLSSTLRVREYDAVARKLPPPTKPKASDLVMMAGFRDYLTRSPASTRSYARCMTMHITISAGKDSTGLYGPAKDSMNDRIVAMGRVNRMIQCEYKRFCLIP